jgi:glucokinase
MRRRYDHVSYERVCSGIGIPNIHEYLRDSDLAPESPAVSDQLRGTSDRARIIIDAALASPPDPLCLRTLEIFVSILGAEAGNLALKVLATGGVYLAGGIPRNILPLLKGETFLDAFCGKGRLGHVLAGVPVHVIRGDAALIGAAICVLNEA